MVMARTSSKTRRAEDAVKKTQHAAFCKIAISKVLPTAPRVTMERCNGQAFIASVSNLNRQFGADLLSSGLRRRCCTGGSGGRIRSYGGGRQRREPCQAAKERNRGEIHWQKMRCV